MHRRSIISYVKAREAGAANEKISKKNKYCLSPESNRSLVETNTQSMHP